MPTLAIFSDPTLQKREFYEEVDAATLVETINHAYEAGMRFDRPMQIMVDGELVQPIDENGEPKRSVLKMKVKPKSLVVVSPQVGDPTGGILTAILTVISVAASVASVFLLKQPAVPERGLTSKSRYTFDGETNRNRRGEPVLRPYGRNVIYPDFGALSFTRQVDNVENIFLLYCLGDCNFSDHSIKIGDTDIDNFSDVEHQRTNKGEAVTLFNTNVVTVPAVQDVEIKLNGVGGSDGFYPDTGGWIVGEIGEDLNRVEFDIEMPLGQYVVLDGSPNHGIGISLDMQFREIDDNGDPVGDGSWALLYRYYHYTHTSNPVARTVGVDVDHVGRYEVRINFHGINYGNVESKWWRPAGGRYAHGQSEYRDKTILGNIRYAKTDVPQTFPDTSMLAVIMPASQALNGDAAQKVNIDCTAHRPVLKVETDAEGDNIKTFTEEATRSVIMAFIDCFRNKFGAALTDEYLDLEALFALEQQNAADGRFFDWVFDQKIPAWEAAGMIGKVCRGTPVIDGSLVTMTTDGEVDAVTAYFSPYNIKQGSLKQSIKTRDLTENTGLTIEYVDDTTAKQEQIVCLVDADDNETKLKKVVYAGQRDRDWSYRDGLTMRAKEKRVNKFVSFDTGREGFPLKFGDSFGLASDVTNIGDNFGQVLDITGTTMTLDTDVDLTDLTDPTVAIRTNTGGMSGPWGVTAGANSKQLILDNPINTVEIDVAANAELPWFVVGDAVYEIYITSSIQPSGLDTVSVEGSIYDASVYAYDSLTAPARGAVPTQPSIPDLPTVTGLEVTDLGLLSLTALATWDAALGSKYYVVEVSLDGIDWQRIDTTTNTFMRVPVIEGQNYVRVAGFGLGLGAWDTWSGVLEWPDYDIDGFETITIVHNLGYRPNVRLIDNEGDEYYAFVEHIDNDTVRISASVGSTLEGEAILR